MVIDDLGPDLQSRRDKRDETLSRDIQRLFNQNFRVYGERNRLFPLKRKGFPAAKCTLEHLM